MKALYLIRHFCSLFSLLPSHAHLYCISLIVYRVTAVSDVQHVVNYWIQHIIIMLQHVQEVTNVHLILTPPGTVPKLLMDYIKSSKLTLITVRNS